MRSLILIGLISVGLSGCYYIKSGYNQMSLLSKRIPIEKALADKNLTEIEKQKLKLTNDVMQFAREKLHLEDHGNYTTYVHLDRPYVTYVVSAAPQWELKHYLWSFPIVGSVPYKGFFDPADAESEEQSLIKKNYDTYLRGVSAFSTLGWFRDPILSSMLKYSDEDLVNTLIHETIHANIYIKGNADFNERLAVFMGNWGTELFYKNQKQTATLEKIKNANSDEKIFAEFITKEIQELEVWYKNLTEQELEQKLISKESRLKEIQERFKHSILPKMKTHSYDYFANLKLNNARLLIYKTYLQDLSQFERLAERVNFDYKIFLEKIKTLEKHKDPELGLKELLK